MMKKNFLKQKSGFTLIEVIIAGLVSLIMLTGVATVDYSVRMMYKQQTPESLLAVETTAILRHISRNIQAATGDTNNVGIILVGEGTALAIRQDRTTSQTPGDYTDDVWMFYHLNTTDHTVEFCEGQDSCVTLLTSLGFGKIKSIMFDLTRSNAQTELDNQVKVTISACANPPTCPDGPPFNVSTKVSMISHGGDSL